MDLMADTIDGLESLGHINTAAAETVELDTSREDVRMDLKVGRDGAREGALKSKSAIDLSISLVLVGLAFSIIAAHTRAVIRRASDDARSIAFAALVALLADTHVKELVGEGLRDDLADHVINGKLDLLLVLEGSVVLLSGLKIVVQLSKLKRDEVLRDSGLILLSNKLTVLVASNHALAHESRPGEVLEAKVTILAWASRRLLSGIVVRILEDGAEVDILAVLIDGADPTMRPAGSDISAELRILKASIRGSRGRSRSGDVDVLREVLLVEHGARIAGRHEEDESLEHLLGLHGIENSGEIVVVEELVSGHGDDTRVTVIIVEDENIIISSRLKSLAAASTSGITRENIDKVLNIGLPCDIILDNTLININVLTTLLVKFVVDLTGEWVLRVHGDIIFEESDDVLVRDTSLVSKLISLAHGGLVTIVTPASATGNENNPGVTTVLLAGLDSLIEKLVLLIGKSKSNDCKCNKDSLHHV